MPDSAVLNTYPRPFAVNRPGFHRYERERSICTLYDIWPSDDSQPFVSVSEEGDVILGFRDFGNEVFFRLTQDHARVYLRGLGDVVAPERRTDDDQ